MKIALCCSIIVLLYSCSPKIGSTIIVQRPALPDTAFVLVLQLQDDFINDGIEIGRIKSGDNGLSKNCSYYEVIDMLKQLARQNGANLIKITAQKHPDQWSTCERLTARIYNVPDFRKHEKEIEWSDTRKLTWEDFKGKEKPVSNPGIAALTYCGFGFQTNYMTLFTKAKIFTTNSFTCMLSWVRSDQKDRVDLLEHEQKHFDLCEVYTRLLRKKLEEKKLTVVNINTDAAILFKEVYALYLDRQELYDKQTNHGLNRQAQVDWGRDIQQELDRLYSYKR